MEQKTNTAVAVSTEQNRVTQKLLMDYLKQTNSNLLPNEQAQFMAIAGTFNLNPWKREVYAVAYGQGNGRKLSIIVGYEVYLRRAEEFPQYDGYETKFFGEGANMGCTCTVHRKDRNHPIGSTVFLREYSQNNQMWNTKPHVMLEKVAIATAMRRAFPSEFNGMPYSKDELPDNMTNGSEVLDQQGYVEVAPDSQETPTEATNAEGGTKAHTPLSDARRAKFYEFVARENRRVGKAAFDALLEKYGGLERLVADSDLSTKFAHEISVVPDYTATEVNDEEVPL
ncbi:phage recombination protein Bet [Fibrobacter sp. UWH4]|uniref:phage recombination protein Bet n=1 Tax=Fibrobacter sp. UWH4 TaxID=1896210 RepID=UPI000921E844|nr:phage recombination protein Bet [Fibrobacter sp. UWH4]SHL05633.1 phage recombination protein Bet [Fibrobacter sp. UWH4]